MSWQTTVHPWSYDFDYLGHLTAAVYPKAFEQAYLKEILEENASIQVVIRPVRLGQSSIDLTELLLDANGVVCNRSASTLVAWDVAARRSRRLTTSERDALTDDVESTPQTHPRGPIPADKTGDRNPQ
ncbi:hypothetical protein [Mycolicibacterium sp. CBMA 361]|uniref:acyl-CoA thioesterase n=1 Tax=Mycolicibacterium sp. CBMA 361 TaxID=2606610 RepID=UPI00139682F5|nr:hypothetical protein [Mycolicibacterium sp. CBMA 361]